MAEPFDIKPFYQQRAWVNAKDYATLYRDSIENAQDFWGRFALEHIDFIKPFSRVCSGDFDNIKWFEDGTLNVCHQCVDRHLPTRAEQAAILWEGDEPGDRLEVSYQTLHDEVCRMSNLLKAYGVKKGDRVCIYLPMVVEATYAMLACARIGAVHSVVFAGFSPEALRSRIEDAQCKFLITTNTSNRGGKKISLFANVEQAISGSNTVEQVLLIDAPEVASDSRIIEWQKAKTDYATECPVEEMHAEDPLFILYTSGSTGKPKGIVHSSAGYILYAAMTHKYIFDYHDGDIYWCGADVGWITGHSYIVYGPLANGATTLMFAGTPTYPTAARFWQVIDKYKVNIFYTAPTAIRTLIKAGDDWVKQTDRSSLRLLGSVGEPINPEVWLWYHDVVGNKQCPVIDTWWQTETGGIMISPLPGAIPQKPGYAQTPFFGIEPILLDDSGQPTAQGKLLAIKQPWPGMARTIYNDHKRYKETYFKYGCYIPGDEALQDPNGDLRITGRMDDVLNVSGHRIGTAEIESAILEHSAVAEAAVVGMKHDIKGEAIYAFVTLKSEQPETEEMKREITQVVRREIGAIATPEVIQWAAELPKTRSGKIMRRILKKIANRDTADLGDLSTLADPAVIQNLTSIPRG